MSTLTIRSAPALGLLVAIAGCGSTAADDASNPAGESAVTANPSPLNCSTSGEPSLSLVKIRNGTTLNVGCQQPKAWKETDRTLVLLHGYPEFWRAWVPVIPQLVAAGYRIVAPDQRGYNASDHPESALAPNQNYQVAYLADDVRGLVESLGDDYRSGKKKVTLVAHDWGGLVAWAFAGTGTNPKDATTSYAAKYLDHLIVMNAPHPQAMRETFKDPSQRLASSYVGQLIELANSKDDQSEALVERSTQLISSGALPLDAQEKERYLTAWRAKAPNSNLISQQFMVRWYAANVVLEDDGVIKDGKPFPYVKFIRDNVAETSIPVPVLAVFGKRDFAAISLNGTHMDSESFRKTYLPNPATQVKTIDAGHFVMHETPDVVAKLILDFVKLPVPPTPPSKGPAAP
jgi:epoxide hydrolase 4